MDKMTNRVKELSQCLGAAAVGIATIETLAGAPPLCWSDLCSAGSKIGDQFHWKRFPLMR